MPEKRKRQDGPINEATAKEREVENYARLLDKLPQEVWEKILDELKEDDLFPVALSCRYFRHKQVELVARASQHGRRSGKPRLALKTNLKRKLDEDQPASAEYLRFCSKENGSPPSQKSKHIRYLAAFHGYLPLLQELLVDQHGVKQKMIEAPIAAAAARGGKLESLVWLWKSFKRMTLSAPVFMAGAESGEILVLKWLRSVSCPWDASVCAGAARGGHMEALKWLKSAGCPRDRRSCEAAARHGHLDALKYLHENGCPWDERTCAEAAKGGHLDVLKYLHESGCPWNVRTCQGAAAEGHLDVLKYAREHGCPWDEETYHWACHSGHHNVVNWLKTQFCPGWNTPARPPRTTQARPPQPRGRFRRRRRAPHPPPAAQTSNAPERPAFTPTVHRSFNPFPGNQVGNHDDPDLQAAFMRSLEQERAPDLDLEAALRRSLTDM